MTSNYTAQDDFRNTKDDSSAGFCASPHPPELEQCLFRGLFTVKIRPLAMIDAVALSSRFY